MTAKTKYKSSPLSQNIAKGDSSVAFSAYLDIVNKCGERSRLIVNVCMIVSFCIATTVLNTYIPAWNKARFIQIQEAIVCWESRKIDAKCRGALDYAKFRGFELLNDKMSLAPADGEIVREIRHRADDLSKKDLDQNSFTVPFFNAAVDVNDLWVLTGIVITFIYFMIYNSLQREFDAVTLAYKYAGDKQNLELLRTTRILATPSWIPSGGIILSLPLLITAYTVWDFYDTYQIGYELIGRFATLCIVVILNLLSGLQVLLYFCALRALRRIDRIFNAIGEKL